jgi:hypothetical protein
MSQDREKSIDDLFEESIPIESALRNAVQKAILRHKKMGNPIAVWEDSRLVWIPPERIEPAEGAGNSGEEDPDDGENG